jgi:hypothetical protein
MSLEALRLPPGVLRAGTVHDSKGRWYDASGVRFFAKTIGPIGGWATLKKTDLSAVTVTGVPRAARAWRGNDGKTWLAIGTESKIYAYNNGTLTDITPTDFTTGQGTSGGAGGAYGTGAYGAGFYSVGNGVSWGTASEEAGTWQLDTFGQYLVGVMTADEKIRYWTLDTALNMEIVHASAPDAVGVVVTSENFLFALGANTKATGTLTLVANAGNNETVVIGGKTYTFQTTLTNSDGNVLIGASASASIDNLIAAINLGAGSGSLYAAATTANEDVSAEAGAGDTMVVTALAGGTPGNDVTTTETLVNASWGAAALSGGTGSIRTVRWPSQESLTDWTASATNTAGDKELVTDGRVLCGARLPRETLIWTDADVHAATYIGGEFIYGFEQRGDQCGIISSRAFATIGDGALWMGKNGFYAYSGAVSPLPCEVQDYVFGRLNRAQATKVWAATNSQFSEVWWFYPSTTDEVDSYVVYNYVENHWSIGSMARSCGVDRDPIDYPVWCDSSGNVYEHERSNSRTGLTAYLETGPIEFEDGAISMIRRFLPDERSLGQLSLYIKSAFNLTDTETTSSEITCTAPTPVRQSGAYHRFKFEEQTASDWRLGVPRFDIVTRGMRR